jgi:ribulose-5-phosphate 4-epimerase/fuculose-1-phosphate aldolase
MDDTIELVGRFVAACRDAARRGLMQCSSGNMSWRIGEDRMLITATRSWLSRLSPEHVTLCRIRDARALDGKTPTIEAAFHAGILRARPDMNVVMHFQTPCATALACRDPDTVNYNVLPEVPVYMGPVAHVPYLPPGSPELAEAVIDAMRTHDLAQLANHGQVTAARDFDGAVQVAAFFELACSIVLHGGPGTVALPDTEVRRLLAQRAGAQTLHV